MRLAFRVALYALFLTGAVVFVTRFRATYHSSVDLSAQVSGAAMDSAGPDAPPTNAVSVAPAAPGTNDLAGSAQPAGPSTNEPAGGAGTNKAGAGPGKPARPVLTLKAQAAEERSRAFMYMGLFLASLIGAGLLGAWDVVHYLGGKAGRSVMAEDYSPPSDPVYDEAEEQWAKGNHLEAVGLMREYLKKNPNEQHAAIRIAEIYEKDLSNPLAAALELEEVLTKRLPAEKWGWTAIHLANLYSGKLNQPEKAMGILERLANEQPGTAAAKKARQRLGWPEPAETPEGTPGAGTPPSEPSDPNMPRGFSSKR